MKTVILLIVMLVASAACQAVSLVEAGLPIFNVLLFLLFNTISIAIVLSSHVTGYQHEE